MLREDFADEHQSDALSVGFGREERREEFGGDFRRQATSRVGNLQADGRRRRANVNIPIVSNRFGGILYDIEQDLFEECAVEVNGHKRRGKVEMDADVAVHADCLHKAFAGEDQFVETNRCQRR